MTTNAFTQKPDVSRFIKDIANRHKAARFDEHGTKFRTWGKITPVPFGEQRAKRDEKK